MSNNSKQQVTDENLTVSRSKKLCTSSGTKGKYSELIPVDIVIDILSKLPAKSMAKCRCVSKLWSSIIRPPYYDQLFPVKSPAIRKLLFAFVRGGKCYYFSSPQPQNPYEENMSLVATRHSTRDFSQICRPVHGLVCHQRTRENYTVTVIYNPITGQYINLPKLTNVIGAKSFLGYDPIDKQFKVLCITMMVRGKENYSQYQVLTLETGRKHLLWRYISRSRPYHNIRDDAGICINGILYYYSNVDRFSICCFDVRSERVYSISGRSSTLINYQGKLGAVEILNDTAFELSVLEDAMKHQWSRQLYIIPFQLQGLDDSVYSAGVAGRDEVVFYPKSVTEVPFYMCYYNLVTNIAVKVRVEVPAFECFNWHRLFMFPNYVEDMKILFATIFSHDSNSKPRVWTGKEDIREITKMARSASLKLLSVMAIIRLDNELDNVDKILSLALVDSTNSTTSSKSITTVDSLASSTTWEQVAPTKTLITPVQCKSLWRQFKNETQYTVTQAISAQVWLSLTQAMSAQDRLHLQIKRNPTLQPPE